MRRESPVDCARTSGSLLDRTIASRLRYAATMQHLPRIEASDRALIQIVDAAVAEAARKSGPWLVCRMGCTQCCIGPFPISQLDALRLQRGLRELEAHDPERALRLRDRARRSVARIARDFPGDPVTGQLAEGEAAEERFANFADDEPCP